jgi:cobalt-zinc-cadmium efflux system protein
MAESHANPLNHDHPHGHKHGHEHGHEHGHSHSHGAASRRTDSRALAFGLLITTVFMIAEAIGGWISGSLALIADAGHMFTDASALALSLTAIWLARKPAERRRTYGLYRAEILAALINAVTLFVICGFIFYEAYHRFITPPPVESRWMLGIAVMGLIANGLTFFVLWRSGGESLNLRGALLHVIGDMLGSVGAIAAALVIMFTGWYAADPLISVIIAVLIAGSAWHLLYETLRVLLEIAPKHIRPVEVENALSALPGVAEVHDVHVWTITSGMDAVSGHLRLTDDDISTERLQDVLARAYKALEPFNLEHVTLQVEPFHHKDPPSRF